MNPGKKKGPFSPKERKRFEQEIKDTFLEKRNGVMKVVLQLKGETEVIVDRVNFPCAQPLFHYLVKTLALWLWPQYPEKTLDDLSQEIIKTHEFEVMKIEDNVVAAYCQRHYTTHSY